MYDSTMEENTATHIMTELIKTEGNAISWVYLKAKPKMNESERKETPPETFLESNDLVNTGTVYQSFRFLILMTSFFFCAMFDRFVVRFSLPCCTLVSTSLLCVHVLFTNQYDLPVAAPEIN